MSNAFAFTDYDSDFITQFLKEQGDKLPPDITTALVNYATTQQNRDNDLEDYLSFQSYVPSIGLSLSTAQAANPSVVISFTSIAFQSTTVLSWVNTDPTKITLLAKGIVSIVANASFDVSTGGNYRAFQIYVNGSAIPGAPGLTLPPIGGGSTTLGSLSIIQSLQAGDYIQLFCLQDTGGSLNAQGMLQVAYLGQSSS